MSFRADHAWKPAPRILVVDDDAESYWLVSRVLFRQGYIVEHARHGEEACLKLLLFQLPDLIILDLDMPVMDGRTFRKIQLAYERFATIPVIVRSANIALKSIALSLQVSASCGKGEPLSHLLATIDRILENRGLHSRS